MSQWSRFLNDENDIFTKKRCIWDFTPRKQYTVSGMYVSRIDLIARDTLAQKTQWWILAEANNIIFPFDELTYGKSLNLLAVSEPEIYSQLLRKAAKVTVEL